MVKAILRNKKGPRREIILNLDQDERNGLWSAAILKKSYKLIWGQNKLLKQKVNVMLTIITDLNFIIIADAKRC